MALSTTLPNSFSTLLIDDLINTFGLENNDKLIFENLEITDKNKLFLEEISVSAIEIENWNEQELIIKYVGPILNHIDIKGENFNTFAERNLSARVDGIRLTGKVDFVVSSGVYNPSKPYFFIQEYKQQKNPSGDPFAQLLGEMLVAQVLNGENLVYGAYIIGRFWYFVVMEKREYSVSKPFDSVDLQDLTTILSKLNWIKNWVREKVENL